MATPESTPHYTPNVSDERELQVADRLRGYLANDPLTASAFQGIIREFPVTTALESDSGGNLLPPAASLHIPMEFLTANKTMGIGSGNGRYGATYQLILRLVLSEDRDADADALDNLYRRLWNNVGLWKRALLNYEVDPATSGTGIPPLWHNLLFPSYTGEGGGRPAVILDRVPQDTLSAIITFTLTAVPRRP
jgi:hypothetical protein